ncbi:unnamed protein product [Paramecium pentaurelia]|uniref:Uncharacterized protein n=1 Tax=Paramecium pentaurelia TaxID=43138 RepID=A0A8S1YI41_9CILI|nr:unnamed protein product [Paramecium pentaurelia]
MYFEDLNKQFIRRLGKYRKVLQKEQDNQEDNPKNGYTDNVHVAKNYQVSREVEVNLLVCKKKKLFPQLQNEDLNIKSKQSRIFQNFGRQLDENFPNNRYEDECNITGDLLEIYVEKFN